MQAGAWTSHQRCPHHPVGDKGDSSGRGAPRGRHSPGQGGRAASPSLEWPRPQARQVPRLDRWLPTAAAGVCSSSCPSATHPSTTHLPSTGRPQPLTSQGSPVSGGHRTGGAGRHGPQASGCTCPILCTLQPRPGSAGAPHTHVTDRLSASPRDTPATEPGFRAAGPGQHRGKQRPTRTCQRNPGLQTARCSWGCGVCSTSGRRDAAGHQEGAPGRRGAQGGYGAQQLAGQRDTHHWQRAC